jgi:hypothetical protein
MSKYGKPEIYSRFLRHDWVKEQNTRIHHKAFMPSPNDNKNREEVSCFETQNLDNDAIRQISRENQILPNNKPPVGHCSIIEQYFLWDKLSLDRNYIPERHIDIIGWEVYPSKEDIKELASQLAEISSDIIIIY